MKYLSLFILVCLQFMNAQTYEVGLLTGGTNYIGDIGSTTYIAPNGVAIGAIGKWNRSKRHAFRGSITFGSFYADDKDGDARRIQRGFSFRNQITEFSVGMEFNFFDWYLYNGRPQWTPYLYSGFTGFNYDIKSINNNNQLVSDGDRWSMAIPMVLGIKTTLGRFLVLGAEIGARYTFTDQLDGSNKGKDSGLEFGNLDNNDWYVFTAISLAFTWGRIPCQCTF